MNPLLSPSNPAGASVGAPDCVRTTVVIQALTASIPSRVVSRRACISCLLLSVVIGGESKHHTPTRRSHLHGNTLAPQAPCNAITYFHLQIAARIAPCRA